MDILCFIIVIFLGFSFVASLRSSLYHSSDLTDVDLTQANSQTITVGLLTECVMRCQSLTKEAFYTDDGKCICTGDGILPSSITYKNDDDNKLKVSGNFYNGKHTM